MILVLAERNASPLAALFEDDNGSPPAARARLLLLGHPIPLPQTFPYRRHSPTALPSAPERQRETQRNLQPSFTPPLPHPCPEGRSKIP